MIMPQVKNDLLQLLADNNVALQPGYLETLNKVDAVSFSYNSSAMFGMADTLFSSPKMIAYNLLQNAIDEAKGAARVALIAKRYAPEDLKKKMMVHVGDELRHSQQFADLIPLTGFQTQKDLEESKTVKDVFEFDDELKTFLCRVHSIEVRSWTMLRHYINIIENHPDEKLKAAIPVLETIMVDEINHVVYTAEQINQWLLEDPSLGKTLEDCFMHTNRETWTDLAHMSTYLAQNMENLDEYMGVVA